MKRMMPVLLAATFLFGLAARAQTSAPEIPFTSSDILKTPADRLLGEVAGVATNSKGTIFVLTHTGDPTMSMGGSRAFTHGGTRLYEYDASGKFVRELGKGLYGFLTGQQVRIDAQDNIWVVDSNSGMVMKFNPAGTKITMLLGRKPESVDVPQGPPRPPRGNALPGAGTNQDLFDSPADVAWDAAGNIFVADGIGANTRIAKFDNVGKFVKSWGSKGNGNGQFADAHSVQVDAQGNVYVADSGNSRIQVFDNDGNYKSTIGNVGAPAALCLTKGAHPYLYSSNSNPQNNLDSGGEIYKLELSGAVVGKFGRAGKQMKEFGTVNQIDCRGGNTLLVGEIGNYRVQKLSLR